MPGLLKMLREEDVDGVRYAPWKEAGWHREYSPPTWRGRATADQKQEGWEMAVRRERIICTVVSRAHERQVEEFIDVLPRGRMARTSVPTDPECEFTPGTSGGEVP